MITECYKGFIKSKYVPGKLKFSKASFPKYFCNTKKNYSTGIYRHLVIFLRFIISEIIYLPLFFPEKRIIVIITITGAKTFKSTSKIKTYHSRI